MKRAQERSYSSIMPQSPRFGISQRKLMSIELSKRTLPETNEAQKRELPMSLDQTVLCAAPDSTAKCLPSAPTPQRVSSPSPRLLRAHSALAILQHHERLIGVSADSVRSSVWSLSAPRATLLDAQPLTARSVTSMAFVEPVRQRAASWVTAHDEFIDQSSEGQPLWWPTWINDQPAHDHLFDTLARRISPAAATPTEPSSLTTALQSSSTTSWRQSLLLAVKQDRLVDIRQQLLGSAACMLFDSSGNSLLHHAVSTQAVNILIRAGADVARVNKQGNSPLHVHARYGRLPCVLALLQSGAAINALNVELESPLHLAVRFGHAGVVDALVRAGANPNRRNRTGHTPLDVAYSLALPDCLQYLLQAAGVRISPQIVARSTTGSTAGRVRAAKQSKIALDTVVG